MDFANGQREENHKRLLFKYYSNLKLDSNSFENTQIYIFRMYLKDEYMNNFEHITESYESLAKFIDEMSSACAGNSECYNCPIDDSYCNFDGGNGFMKWLKKEYDGPTDKFSDRYHHLRSVANSIRHDINVLMEDDPFKGDPSLYLSLEKMRDCLDLALSDDSENM